MTGRTTQLRQLKDLSCTRPEISGEKGAGLARALAAGFPVLDGFVIPPACSRSALQSAANVLEERGTGGSRMSIIGYELPSEFVDEIDRFAEELQAPLIVRSSSMLEGDGEWSGAFTSIPEVQNNEVVKAMKSVWATTFALEVLERFEAAGLEPGSAPMGVLVQSEIQPEFGGAAIVDGLGAVTINAVKGSPKDLMAGWVPGVRAVLEEGELRGAEAIDLVGRDNVMAVADLALRVRQELGNNLIEWAIVDGEPILLQVQNSAIRGPEETFVIPAALAHSFAADFIRLTQQHSGPLSDELVLGWRSAANHDLVAVPYSPVGSPEDILDMAREMCGTLLSQAWNEPVDAASTHAASVLKRFRSHRPNESIDVLRDLDSVDNDLAARLLGMIDYLESTDRSSLRRGIGKWEPVLAGVVALQGEPHEGEPSVGGIGAGRLIWIESSKRTEHVRPRDIIVTQYPLQNFSPLLWDAAGIITIGGAPTAHLFEVARSLTVPAVINCPISNIVKSGPRLGMLDGDAGRVAILD